MSSGLSVLFFSLHYMIFIRVTDNFVIILAVCKVQPCYVSSRSSSGDCSTQIINRNNNALGCQYLGAGRI